MFCRKFLFLAVLAGIAMAGLASPAQAQFRLRVEDTDLNVGIVLTGAVNTAATPSGVLTFSGAIGNFSVTITTAITYHVANGGVVGELDLSNTSVSSVAGGHLRITAEDTGYIGNSNPMLLTAAVGGTIKNGSLLLQSWSNGSNAIPALGADQALGSLAGNPIGGIPGGSTAAFAGGGDSFTGGSVALPFSDSASKLFSGTPFSLFAQVTMTLNAGGVTSLDDDQQTLLTPVPAGLIMALSGAPCLGFGAWLRRRKVQMA